MKEMFFIPEENRVKIDMHGFTKDDVMFELDNILDNLDKLTHIYVIVAVHGYKLGEVILNYIRKEYRHKNAYKIVPDKNPGVTLIYTKNYMKLK